jgi:deoxyribodipyrimidine photolyase-related protein
LTNERLSVWILGDQLLADHPALVLARRRAPRSHIHVVLVESAQRAARLPYHRQKLTLLFSAMRHYAAWLDEQGYQVDYQRSATTLAGLQAHLQAVQPTRLLTMAASDYRGRQWQQGRLSQQVGLPVQVLPNSQFLVSQFDPYPLPDPGKHYLLEYFYRAMRKHFGILMDGAAPVGGEWNYDSANRQPYPKTGLQPPPVPSFAPDAITQEVMDEVRALPDHVGALESFGLAVTHTEAQAALDDFIEHRLPLFGAYEDAMSQEHGVLYHSMLSPYLNIGLLTPMQTIRAVLAAWEAQTAPLNSVEGFIRQVLGWREFMYWQYWRSMPGLAQQNAWECHRPLSAALWTGQTRMNCLHQVWQRLHHTGYLHHIERLMLLSNFCLLMDVEPLAVNDWFLTYFIDAYEWVMLPNVLGMGLNADGGVIATKPYIASANYINKMGNYCKGCQLNPKERLGESACPFNALYWDFVLRNRAVLSKNQRSSHFIKAAHTIPAEDIPAIQAQAERWRAQLGA